MSRIIKYNSVADDLLKIKPDKRTDVFNWGEDNAEPSLIEGLIKLSVTASKASQKVAKAIFGAGFGEPGKVVVNSKGESLNEILRKTAYWLAKQSNAFLHVNYNLNLDISSIVVLPVPSVRVGKADSKKYSGKIVVYDNWDKSKKATIKKEEFAVYDTYSTSKKVVGSQILNASKEKEKTLENGLKAYKGQVLHIKKDDTEVYSSSDLESVLYDAVTEYHSSIFRSKGATKGFLNASVMSVPAFQKKEEKEEFVDDLNEMQGAKGSNDLLVVEAPQGVEDITKALEVRPLAGAYNDKLFEYSDKRCEISIAKAFSVPLILIAQSENSIFGSSGEMLKEAKLELWEDREEERLQVTEVFENLIKRSDFEGGEFTIKNPFMDEDQEAETKNVNKKAQATLRGSVGGVTSLIALQQAVQAGTLTKESAVATIKIIYGLSEKKAKEMVGGFEDENED